MVQEVRNRQVAGANPGENGLLPLNSFEGISKLYAKGKMDLDKAKNLVADEILEIEGVPVKSHTLLEMLFLGPDKYGNGWFFAKIPVNPTETVEIKMKFLRKIGEWLPQEWTQGFEGGPWTRIWVVPKFAYDRAEGHSNPREKNKCSYCNKETTQIRLIITHTTVRGRETEKKRTIFADVILHCGHFQVKRTGSSRR